METEKRNVLEDVTESMKQVDGKHIVRLLKNPLDSLHLSEKDFVYGVLGLVASFVGYLIWVLLMGRKLVSIIYGVIPFGGFDMLGGLQRSVTNALFGRLFVLGLLSTIALLAAVWLIGGWRSGKLQPLKLFVTRIGGIHYIGGVGFIAAGILSFSLQLSFLLIVLTLLTLLVLTVYGGSEASGVSRERMSSYLMLSVAGYVLLAGMLASTIL